MSLTRFFSTGIDRHKLASRSNPCDHITYTAHMSRCRLSGRAVDCHDTGSVDCHAGTCPRHLSNSLLSLSPPSDFSMAECKDLFQTKLSEFHHSYIHHILLFRVFNTVSLDNDVNLFLFPTDGRCVCGGRSRRGAQGRGSDGGRGTRSSRRARQTHTCDDSCEEGYVLPCPPSPLCNSQIEPFWFDKVY